jgi:hypothetical protein
MNVLTSVTPAFGDDRFAGLPPAVQMIVALVTVVLVAISYVVSSVLLSLFFRTVGIPMWKAWVPVYSTWVFLELGALPGALSLLALTAWVPLVGTFTYLALVVATVIAAHRMLPAFGLRSGWWTVLYFFFAPIWWLVLAVGPYDYRADLAPARAATGQG